MFTGEFFLKFELCEGAIGVYSKLLILRLLIICFAVYAWICVFLLCIIAHIFTNAGNCQWSIHPFFVSEQPVGEWIGKGGAV